MPDVFSCGQPQSEVSCAIPWGISLPVGASFAVFFLAVTALILLLAGRCCSCANGPVVRIIYGQVMLAVLGSLLFVASVLFLMYSREPAWKRAVAGDPASICKYEKAQNCRGLRDVTCKNETCAECGGPDIPPPKPIADRNATEIANLENETKQCFSGYTNNRGHILANGLTSPLVSFIVVVDFLVLLCFSLRNKRGEAAPSKIEEQDETPDA